MALEIGAGDLNRRVTLTSITRVSDAAGGWTHLQNVITTWARVRALRGDERLAYQMVASEVDYEIVIRYRGGISPDMTVQIGARKLEIVSVIDDEEKHRYLVIGCHELEAAPTPDYSSLPIGPGKASVAT